MSTEEIDVVEETQTETTTLFALLFELEYVAVDARQATYDLFHSLLSESGVDITPVHFSRYCLHPSPEFSVPSLLDNLDGKAPKADKLTDDITSGLAMFYTSGEAVLREDAKTIIDLAQSRKADLGAISCQDPAAAEALMENIGLNPEEISVFAYSAASHSVFPRVDMWLKITKTLGKSPRNCVAVVSSAVSAKAALSSGMRCIALPDSFTRHQDFGGADAVLDPFDESELKELADLVFPQVD